MPTSQSDTFSPFFTARMAGALWLAVIIISSLALAGQMQVVALGSIRLFGLGFKVSMVYFGLQCAAVGYLIARSGFMPRLIGILLAIGGSFYVISSFAAFLSPELGNLLAPVVIPAAFIGEGATTLWLLLKGVNVDKWMTRAGATSGERVAA